MAERDYYDLSVVVNPAGDTWAPVAGVTLQAFAVDDLAYTTPLRVEDPISSVEINPLKSSTLGGLRPFSVEGDPTQIILKAGDFVTRLTSMYGRRGVPGPSAYEQALLGGFLGTQEAFITSLAQLTEAITDIAIEGGELTVRTAGGAESTVGPVGGGGIAREVQLQTSATHIQWRYAGDTAWTNLIALADLKGSTGAPGVGSPGAPGAAVQMRVNGGYLQWKLATDSTWSNLIAIADIGGGSGTGNVRYLVSGAWQARGSSPYPVTFDAGAASSVTVPSDWAAGDHIISINPVTT